MRVARTLIRWKQFKLRWYTKPPILKQCRVYHIALLETEHQATGSRTSIQNFRQDAQFVKVISILAMCNIRRIKQHDLTNDHRTQTAHLLSEEFKQQFLSYDAHQSNQLSAYCKHPATASLGAERRILRQKPSSIHTYFMPAWPYRFRMPRVMFFHQIRDPVSLPQTTSSSNAKFR